MEKLHKPITQALLACGLLVCVSPANFAAQPASGLAALKELCRSAITRGEYDQALKLCKRFNFDASKLAARSPEHIESVVSIGDIQFGMENYVDADAYYSEALALATEQSGEDSVTTKELLATLIETKLRRGKSLEALALMERLLVLHERAAAPNDPRVAVVRIRYADLLAQTHQYPKAEVTYQSAIETLQEGGKATVQDYALAVQRLAEMYELRMQLQFAEQQYGVLLGIVERNALGTPLLVMTLDRLGYVCEAQGRSADAQAFYQRELLVLNAENATPEVTDRARASLARLESMPLPPAP